MSNSDSRSLPSDQTQRQKALDPANSILVQAPAGSGKTDLLTRRFLRLLVDVEDPAEIAAITFTKAAAAEMRHRILSKLELATSQPAPKHNDAFSMEALSHRALARSRALGWKLLDQPGQLRISTIDSFCREIALQQPLLSGLGDGLDVYENSDELYRRAARRTIEQIDSADENLRNALELLLQWRDNNWAELEDLLSRMLATRDRWIHDFVVGQQQDWESLRQKLERPFAIAAHDLLGRLEHLLGQAPSAVDEALALVRFACENGADMQFMELAELAEFPSLKSVADEVDVEALEDARRAHSLLACFLLTNDGSFRKAIDKRLGFPADRKVEKARLTNLINALRDIDGLEAALRQVRELPPMRYSEAEWQILRACFTLLRHSAAHLQVVFSEVGAVDYIEVAQIAQAVLRDGDGLPSEAALSLAGKIRHILVDEFQDTSRRQHEMLRLLISAWPDREGRSCFVVGDPMQSIYFFRDADAELFPRVRTAGLELYGNDPLEFESVQLKDNFRTLAPLVTNLNAFLGKVFEKNDGSGVTFSEAEPARPDRSPHAAEFKLHMQFLQQDIDFDSTTSEGSGSARSEENPQTREIVELISGQLGRIEQAKAEGRPHRIAVLGRTRAVLAPIAGALREAFIPFRAVDLEKLATRPEVLDVLALARALLNPFDRVSWLGVLRAPWCGLSLNDLHILTSADDPVLLAQPVRGLLSERLSLLSAEGQAATARVLDVLAAVPSLRFTRTTTTLGTWLKSVWELLGGDQCVNQTARVNLDLLWQSLDKLPNGEMDLLSPALEMALEKLTAQPAPDADSEYGVQLMTIHKSKGLEFEVVVLPELQAPARKGHFKMLSWLERGLAPDQRQDHSDDVTEFLVAPLQSKGSERSEAKAWVDRVYAARESQEMRRLLYVAATRARDELHIFAKSKCRRDDSGNWILTEPGSSLLGTAWPGLCEEIERQFAQWNARRLQAESTTIESIAAVQDSELLVMPPPVKPTRLNRLPSAFRTSKPDLRDAGSIPSVIGMGNDGLYERHEGGLLTRALGVSVHTLLEQAARLRQNGSWDETRSALSRMTAHLSAQIRASGLDPVQANRTADQALEIALNATRDAVGQWILSPHADSASEARWAGVVRGKVRTVQVDRIFRAGTAPQSEDATCWWIVDYKTAHADDLGRGEPTALLARLRPYFEQQLQAYAEVLLKLKGAGTQIRAGLYYPRMSLFDWWKI
jgi:ATP-dependent exoDNAse (exonuclease V) beta subunit (contains helicase and exonuclease domains)